MRRIYKVYKQPSPIYAHITMSSNLVPRPVTESLTQQISYHIQSLSRWHIKPRITSSHRVFDTSNLVPHPVTESVTQQTSYHVQSQNHWHSKPRTTCHHIGTINF